MSEQEEWRPVPGFPDYRVSSLGRVGSFRRRRSFRALSPFLDDGYPMIKMYDSNGRRIKRSVHQIVAEAFIGPRPEGLQIRHLDGDPSNSAPSNLAYGTASENMQDQLRHGTHHQASKTHCPKGHAYTLENTRMSAAWGRRCRTCHRAISMASYYRRTLRAASVPSEQSA